MTSTLRRLTRTLGTIALLAAVGASTALAQPPAAAPAPVTGVLVSLTIKPGADPALVAQTMPAEVRDTVQAYLDGKILQWFARADGTGVIFIVNATTTAAATAIMDALPLGKAHLADFTYTPLTPLTPLRRLIEPPPAKD
jgi:hypothetical protein